MPVTSSKDKEKNNSTDLDDPGTVADVVDDSGGAVPVEAASVDDGGGAVPEEAALVVAVDHHLGLALLNTVALEYVQFC